MKIIVPMAGRGSRLRPHTLTVPKPLIPVAGQPIVHRLVKDIAEIVGEQIEEVAFILGDEAFFGDDVVTSLKKLAEDLGAKASIYLLLSPPIQLQYNPMATRFLDPEYKWTDLYVLVDKLLPKAHPYHR